MGSNIYFKFLMLFAVLIIASGHPHGGHHNDHDHDHDSHDHDHDGHLSSEAKANEKLDQNGNESSSKGEDDDEKLNECYLFTKQLLSKHENFPIFGNVTEFCINVGEINTCWENMPLSYKEKNVFFTSDYAYFMTNRKFFCGKEGDYDTVFQNIIECQKNNYEEVIEDCYPSERVLETIPLDKKCRQEVSVKICILGKLKTYCEEIGARVYDDYLSAMKESYTQICEIDFMNENK